jgi:hypothetical protein
MPTPAYKFRVAIVNSRHRHLSPVCCSLCPASAAVLSNKDPEMSSESSMRLRLFSVISAFTGSSFPVVTYTLVLRRLENLVAGYASLLEI